MYRKTALLPFLKKDIQRAFITNQIIFFKKKIAKFKCMNLIGFLVSFDVFIP